jgi:hypothetical protein
VNSLLSDGCCLALEEKRLSCVPNRPGGDGRTRLTRVRSGRMPEGDPRRHPRESGGGAFKGERQNAIVCRKPACNGFL